MDSVMKKLMGAMPRIFGLELPLQILHDPFVVDEIILFKNRTGRNNIYHYRLQYVLCCISYEVARIFFACLLIIFMPSPWLGTARSIVFSRPPMCAFVLDVVSMVCIH